MPPISRNNVVSATKSFFFIEKRIIDLNIFFLFYRFYDGKIIKKICTTYGFSKKIAWNGGNKLKM